MGIPPELCKVALEEVSMHMAPLAFKVTGELDVALQWSGGDVATLVKNRTKCHGDMNNRREIFLACELAKKVTACLRDR